VETQDCFLEMVGKTLFVESNCFLEKVGVTLLVESTELIAQQWEVEYIVWSYVSGILSLESDSCLAQ
jgi:hypothetical protein